ncbi:MAG: cupin domain-containing protein [Tateyamaria sp.]|uniref:cupin domain-containing protein n=1 Tax=Tateyamaria sp. TaxID=1929288 RepID=UPI00329C361A
MNEPIRRIEWLGMSFKTILTTEASGGSMSIVDSSVPDGVGPPRHVHKAEDEIIIILDGRCELWLDGACFECGPGETAFIPRGTEHTFRVIGGAPCRQIVVLTPGGFEGFFKDMAAGQFSIPEDMPAIDASASRHNMTFTGPPLE